MIEIPANKTGNDLHAWLVENKTTLLWQKKSQLKHADAYSFVMAVINDKGEAVKAESAGVPPEATKIKVRVVINTTKLFDSHSDVHFDGLWNKSLAENKLFYLLQEHSMTFKGIITDEVTAFVKSYTWKQLGYDFEGSTQALVFDCVIDKERNEYMFEQYRKGYVKNHSVGMRYVKIYLCVNNENYSAEYDNWNKYFDKIANPEAVEAQGYFYAIVEAQVVEGSAVPKGSNFVTPTLSVEEENKNIQPVESTDTNRAAAGTQKLDALNNLLIKLKS